MRRRTFVWALGTGAVVLPFAGLAQDGRKSYRIGVLDAGTPTENRVNLDALREGLQALGYVEGKNLTIEYRWSDGGSEHFTAPAIEIVGLGVDAIVVRGAPGTLAAKRATSTIPIVMAGIAEPNLVVESLARPGGNVTGLTTFSSELQVKRLELLRELIPSLVKVGFLTNLGNPATPPQWRDIEAACRGLGLEAQVFDVRSPGEIPLAFERAAASRVQGLIISTDGLIRAHLQPVADFAASHRIAAIYGVPEIVASGGLMAYGPSYPDLYRRAAIYVDKVLKGTKPGDLPIEQPSKFELVLNVKAAAALGIALPAALIARADGVID